MRSGIFLIILVFCCQPCYCWGFFGHKKINNYAVFMLPPQMIIFYKKNIDFLIEHAVDPDKRRYLVPAEGPRHYIDLDHYGKYPYPLLPRNWDSAVRIFSLDTLNKHGIVPWWISRMKWRLTKAFKEKNRNAILKLSAEIGHYIADAHVPLHASSNHNGQYTNQVGIHGFWESRVPELFAEKEYDFVIGKAAYLPRPEKFIWERVLESAAAADTVLSAERVLNDEYPMFGKYAYEERNGLLVRQYSSHYSAQYQFRLKGMVEKRMRQSIFAVASFWYTAWVDAGQPDLSKISDQEFSVSELIEWDQLNQQWQSGSHTERSCSN